MLRETAAHCGSISDPRPDRECDGVFVGWFGVLNWRPFAQKINASAARLLDQSLGRTARDYIFTPFAADQDSDGYLIFDCSCCEGAPARRSRPNRYTDGAIYSAMTSCFYVGYVRRDSPSIQSHERPDRGCNGRAFLRSHAGNSATWYEFERWGAPFLHCWRVHSGDGVMSGAETCVVGQTLEEFKQEVEDLAESAMAPIQAVALDLQENAQSAVDQVKDAVTSALDALAQSGSVDQMRGYATANRMAADRGISLDRAALMRAVLAVAGEGEGQDGPEEIAEDAMELLAISSFA
jgi:hypothetical protein